MAVPTLSSFEWEAQGSWEPHVFSWTADGNIRCISCDKIWCMHIEQLTTENGDADQILEAR